MADAPQTTAEAEGYAAFGSGAPYGSSPYGDDHPNNAAWRQGWREAQRITSQTTMQRQPNRAP